MDIYLIRHADPDYPNDSLTKLGFSQAAKLGEYLRDVPFTHFYCSPAGRAQATMTPVLDGRGLEAKTLEWLCELEGRYDGSTWAWCLTARDLAADSGLIERVADFMADQQAMVVAGFNEVMADHGYRRDGLIYSCRQDNREQPTIAVFAHAGLLLTLLSGLFDWSVTKAYYSLNYPPSGITHLEVIAQDGVACLSTRYLGALPHLHPLAPLRTPRAAND